MDAVTYPEEKVVEAMDKHVIALRLAHDAKPHAVDFNVRWTPALFVLDSDGKSHLDSTGFLPPEELIPWMILGRGKVHFDRDEFDNALTMFNLTAGDYPESDSAPAALFFEAVSRFKVDHEAAPLKEGYERLQDRYPSSLWARKALPYRLL